MNASDTATIFKFREFSRFFQLKLAQMSSQLKSNDYSAQDGRILYEIGFMKDCCATDLQNKMMIDPGFLSHKLKILIKSGLVVRVRSQRDNRVYNLYLTPEGREVLESIESVHDTAVDEMLRLLNEEERRQLRHSMDVIEALLSKGGGRESKHTNAEAK